MVLYWWRYGRAGGCQIYGGIAQLGEHLPCKQGVKGSNPFISIDKSFEAKPLSNVDLACAPAQQELLEMSSVKLACRWSFIKDPQCTQCMSNRTVNQKPALFQGLTWPRKSPIFEGSAPGPAKNRHHPHVPWKLHIEKSIEKSEFKGLEASIIAMQSTPRKQKLQDIRD